MGKVISFTRRVTFLEGVGIGGGGGGGSFFLRGFLHTEGWVTFNRTPLPLLLFFCQPPSIFC